RPSRGLAGRCRSVAGRSGVLLELDRLNDPVCDLHDGGKLPRAAVVAPDLRLAGSDLVRAASRMPAPCRPSSISNIAKRDSSAKQLIRCVVSRSVCPWTSSAHRSVVTVLSPQRAERRLIDDAARGEPS